MSYASVSTHAARSRALASLENLRASSHRAWGALGSRSLMVLPMPLPPDVANKAIRADEKSPASKNVLMMFGAVYHQMGKPISTVSYASTPSGIDFKADLHAGSLHSRVLLLEESVQSRSAAVYASLGAISNSPPQSHRQAGAPRPRSRRLRKSTLPVFFQTLLSPLRIETPFVQRERTPWSALEHKGRFWISAILGPS